MEPLSDADVIWFNDLPHRRDEVLKARKMAPRAKRILQVFESPAVGPHFFVPRNHCEFDAILTYDIRCCDDRRYYHFLLPNTLSIPDEGLPFQARKTACMINTNRVEGYWAVRQRGWEGLPVVGRFLGGWRLDFQQCFKPAAGELYSRRRAIARAADRMTGGLLEVYGPGWNGEPISWCPLYPNRPYSNRVEGAVTRDKKQILGGYRFSIATENYEGSRTWIGEKLFDCLCAGTVPVYLGDHNIQDWVAPECFVDIRRFRSDVALLNYLRDCPEEEWQRMREAGRRFLQSDRIRPFTDEAFAERMVELLLRIADGQ
jgi:hypothetical protein